MKEIVIAVDLGGTNLRTAVVDESGEILFRDISATPRDAERPGGIVRAIAESAPAKLGDDAGLIGAARLAFTSQD